MTLKNRDSSSSPSEIVRSVKTPVQKTIRKAAFSRGKESVLTNRKDKTPPTHIKWEAARCGYHNDGNNEPDDSEAPQNETDEESNNIEHVACKSYIWEAVGSGKQAQSEFAECDDTVAVQYIVIIGFSLLEEGGEVLRESWQTQRPNRKQKWNDDFPFKWLMYGHTKKVESQDNPRQRRSNTPEDVADNKSP